MSRSDDEFFIEALVEQGRSREDARVMLVKLKHSKQDEFAKNCAMGNAIVWLQFTTAYAARFAIGNGVERDLVADMLRELANAIHDPGSVAENMNPILPDEF